MKLLLKRILFSLFIFPFMLQGQESQNIVHNKIEIGIQYTIQRPRYSVTSINDLQLEYANRWRSRWSVGVKYYPLKKWYVNYQVGYSQEGGGYQNQHTNADYLKNSFHVGYATKHHHTLIFDLYTGLDFNTLIQAKWVNKTLSTKENVNDYFNKSYWGLPKLGFGVKTKINDEMFLSLQNEFSFSNYKISNQKIKVAQFILPAVNLSVTKFIK